MALFIHGLSIPSRFFKGNIIVITMKDYLPLCYAVSVLPSKALVKNDVHSILNHEYSAMALISNEKL